MKRYCTTTLNLTHIEIYGPVYDFYVQYWKYTGQENRPMSYTQGPGNTSLEELLKEIEMRTGMRAVRGYRAGSPSGVMGDHYILYEK